MSAASATARGQRRAVALMRDTAVITRGTGEPVTDENGDVTYPTSVVYDGPCKIQTFEPYEQERDAAGQTEVLQRYSLHLPITAQDVARVGDVATVGARQFRINGLHHKTFQTSVRLLVDEITAGAK